MQNAWMAKEPADLAMAKRLIEAREMSFASAADAARAMNITYSTYKNHEDGYRGFKKSAERYAKFFKVDVIWLLYGTGSARGKSLEQRLRALEPEDRQAIERMIDAFETKQPRVR